MKSMKGFNMNGLIDSIDFVVHLLSKKGKIIIHTGVIEHNIFLDDKDYEGIEEEELLDAIIIGEEGRPINAKDISQLSSRLRELFCFIEKSKGSGRSYFFEGFTDEGSLVSICWGT
jgi:hypothetical protein